MRGVIARSIVLPAGQTLYSAFAGNKVPQALMDPTALKAPDVNYGAARPEVAVRVPLSPTTAVFGGAGVLFILSAGQIVDGANYGSADAFGLEASAGLDYKLTDRISVRVAGELERFGQPTAAGTRGTSFYDQPIELGARGRRRSQLGDRPVPVGHDQPLAALDPAQVPAEVLAELADTDRVLHVHKSSMYRLRADGIRDVAGCGSESCPYRPPMIKRDATGLRGVD